MDKKFYEWLDYIRKESSKHHNLRFSDIKKAFTNNAIPVNNNNHDVFLKNHEILYNPVKKQNQFKLLITKS